MELLPHLLVQFNRLLRAVDRDLNRLKIPQINVRHCIVVTRIAHPARIRVQTRTRQEAFPLLLLLHELLLSPLLQNHPAHIRRNLVNDQDQELEDDAGATAADRAALGGGAAGQFADVRGGLPQRRRRRS